MNACGLPTRDRVATIGTVSPLYPEGLRRFLLFYGDHFCGFMFVAAGWWLFHLDMGNHALVALRT
jgi:hypothetical protein